MSVYDLKPGEKGIISNVCGNEKLAKRLSALGFIEGTEVKLHSCAPLGDPIVVQVRGSKLALRKSDLKSIYLKESSIC